ncbi:MAG TPA: zf-HC2 domain-containing protein [bacterium]|nr:zf-HC2 domain-containing protein [bacterium]HPR89132.1 zf-HC2 domain-containing protein [bacterium]
MKRCDKIVQDAYRYYEGALTRQEHAEITTHLANCPACANAFAWTRRTREGLHHLPRHVPSANFDVVLHAKMRHAEYERRTLWPLTMPSWAWQVPAYGAAALLLVAAGVFIDRQLEAPSTLPVSAQMTLSDAAPAVTAPVESARNLPSASQKSSAPAQHLVAGAGGRTAEKAESSAQLDAAATASAGAVQPVQMAAVQPPLKRYVMQKIPMQTLLRENRRTIGSQQTVLEQLAFDTMLVHQQNAGGRNPRGIRAVNASVQF